MGNNDKVRLVNSRDKLDAFAKLTDEVAVGELFMPWHFAEARVNRLTLSDLDPYSKIAPFKLTAVNIEVLK